MIAQMSGMSSFGSCANYLLGSAEDLVTNRVLWVEPRGGAPDDLKEAAEHMEDLARYSGFVETPGYHLTVAFDPNDRVGKEEMLRVADEVKKAMGMGDLMSVVVAHGDAYYPHFHEMICRVNYWTGRAAHPSFPYRKIEMRLRELERAMGLRETPGRHGRLPDQTFTKKHDSRWLTLEERRLAQRALKGARSWEELERRLAVCGLGLRLDRSNLLLVRGPFAVRAGAVQAGTSLKKMEKRMGERFAEHALRRSGPMYLGADAERAGFEEVRCGSNQVAQETRAQAEKSARAEKSKEEPPEVSALKEKVRRLMEAEASKEAAARAVAEATRVELWEGRALDLASRADEELRQMERLFERAFEEPKRASARYQWAGATEGAGAAGARLNEWPGWFGDPTRLGRSAEGALVLQEASERGTRHFEALRKAARLEKRLGEEGGPWVRDGAPPRAGQAVPERRGGAQAAAVLGADRAAELSRWMEASGGRGRGQGTARGWGSPTRARAFARALKERREALGRVDVQEMHRRAKALEREIRGALSQIDEGRRRSLQSGGRSALTEEERRRLAAIATAERSRSVGGWGL